MQIAAGKVAVIDYVLKDDAGEVLDDTKDGSFAYLHGASNIIPGLEEALDGKQAGDAVEVTVEPGKAYGARDPDRVQVVPMDMFEDKSAISPGVRFHAQSPDGQMLMITVVSVEGDEVTIDGNHEFAGMNLNFDVTIIDVRDATEEEVAHGHVHGEGGHNH